MLINRLLAALGLVFLLATFAVALLHDLDTLRCRRQGGDCQTSLEWLR